MCGALIVALLVCPSQGATQGLPGPPPDVLVHLVQIAEQLPRNSFLRHQLEEGDYGSGMTQPWMEVAKRDGVKRALIEVNFIWQRGLHHLRPARVIFFSAYDGPDSQITDTDTLSKFDRDDLTNLVAQAALERAQKGWWLESPEHEHPARKGKVPASTIIVLYDDPWFPVVPSIYGTRDTSWSSLENAAWIGDRVAVKELLSQANLRRVDIDRALVRAAGRNDSWIVNFLLGKGANPNARIKGEGNALTTAVFAGEFQNVEILLRAGADPNSKSAMGETPLSIAIRRGHADMVEILQKAGARK